MIYTHVLGLGANDAMADSRIDIWNVLHDGTITAAAHNGDVVTMFVGIGYLRRLLQPLGDSFVVNLSGVTRCEFRHFDGETIPLPEVFQVGEPDILSTDSKTLPVTIHTTLGELILAFSGISFRLDTGQPVSFGDIADVARNYWDDFEKRASLGGVPV